MRRGPAIPRARFRGHPTATLLTTRQVCDLTHLSREQLRAARERSTYLKVGFQSRPHADYYLESSVADFLRLEAPSLLGKGAA